VAALREASPLYHAERLATPVLLVSSPGETVSREDTKAYRAALKRLNKPHDALAKEDDVDGFNFAKGRTELLTRIEQFLSRHLAPKSR
jgi:dipeptidyl aminopeptidase/acylaminoacyl peptidase